MSPGSSTDWRPGASRDALEKRAVLLADIREFFRQRKVLEVETPVLSGAGNSDPNIESLILAGARPRYLRTSPEYALKRLLASGLGDVYELGRVFRAGEKGRWHNPEFTMLEWYRKGLPYRQLAREVVELVQFCGHGQLDEWDQQELSYQELFTGNCGLDPWTCSEADLENCAADAGIIAGPLNHGEWLDLLLSQVIQPSLPGKTLTIVYDFPAEQSALARIRPGNPPVAERFELYLGQAELANGYQELTNAVEQEERFLREQKLRRSRGETTAPIDQRLLSALSSGLPECSGVALGVDRLLMSLLNLDSIDAVLSFSHHRS